MTANGNQDRSAKLQARRQDNYAAFGSILREIPQVIAISLLVTGIAIAKISLVLALLLLTARYTPNHAQLIILACALILFLTGGLLALFTPSIELYLLRRRGQARRS